MSDTREDYARIAYEQQCRSECQSGDPYCSRNPKSVRNTYEQYTGAICGMCEEAIREAKEEDEGPYECAECGYAVDALKRWESAGMTQ